VDLVSREEVQEVKDHITEINKLAEVIECVKAQVDP